MDLAQEQPSSRDTNPLLLDRDTNPFLLEAGVRREFMCPCLYNAAISGNVEDVQKLLEDTKECVYHVPCGHSGVTTKRNTVLHIAAGLGHMSLANAMCRKDTSLLVSENARSETPLLCAAKGGHRDMVSRIIRLAQESGLEVLRKKNNAGDTALHEAARHGHDEVLKVLVTADPVLASEVNQAGMSPLYLAVMDNSKSAVQALIQCNNASFAGPNGKTALHAAVFLSEGGDQLCPICAQQPETINHLFFRCQFSIQLWNRLKDHLGVGFNTQEHMENGDWLLEGGNLPDKAKSKLQAYAAVLLWHVWKYRNTKCFNSEQDSPEQVWHKTIHLAKEYFESAFAEHTKPVNHHLLIRWEPPPPGWLKVNTDGSFINQDENGGAGFVVRLPNGSPIMAGVRMGKYGSAIMAEAIAMKEALLAARSIQGHQLWIESDSQILVDIVNKKTKASWAIQSVTDDIIFLINNFQNCKITHTFREANKAADWLANHGRTLGFGCTWEGGFPPELLTILCSDSKGALCNRGG